MAIWGQVRWRTSQKGLWVVRGTSTSHYPASRGIMKSFTKVGHLGVGLSIVAHRGWAGGTCILTSCLHCLSAHLTYLWDLGALCWTPAPSGPQKPLFILAVPGQPAFEPLPHPLVRAWCDHQPSTSGGLTSTLPLPFLGGRGDCTPGHCMWEATALWGTGCVQRSETPESLLNWPGGLLGTSAGWWIAAFVLFWDPHIFLCAIGQASALCYQSCDVEDDETLWRSPGCVRLWTLRPFGQFAVICMKSSIVFF